MSPRASAPLALEYVLLGLLNERPMHGYDLFQQVRSTRGIALVWNIKQSLLYAMLDKLEESGLLISELIAGEGYPPRKVFRLTPDGQAAYQKWITDPVMHAREMRQEFLAKLIFARRYGTQPALGLVQMQQQVCQNWLDGLKAGSHALEKNNIDEQLVFSYRINQLEGMLAWLKACETELRLESPAR